MFSLAVLLRRRSSEAGALWREAWGRLVVTGSLSMVIYLFHLYFVVGMRVALKHWLPEPIALVHIVPGILIGCMGPWVLYQLFKGLPFFHWSIGFSQAAPKPAVEEARPAEPLAALPWTSKL
jgi:hypothetical protein